MIFYSREEIENAITYIELVEALKVGFTQEFLVPQRSHISFPNGTDQNTLLIMPAIQVGNYAGVKIVQVSPENSKNQLSTIQGVYYLYEAQTGVPIAFYDAPSLTNIRTSSTSALASSFLSKKTTETMLMIGTGSLAPYLIQAHAAVRPIKKVLVYGRSRTKAENLCLKLKDQFEEIHPVSSVSETLPMADLISSATMSPTPLIEGNHLKSGQHIDLVGAFTPETREADSEVVRRSEVYVDLVSSAIKEAGDIIIPINEETISKSDIKGDLVGLCSGSIAGRTTDNEITLFKSAGHALEDLVTAILIHKKSKSTK